MKRILLGLAGAVALGAVVAHSARAGTATGKVAVEGALATNHPTPRAGDELYLYLNATPLEPAKALELRVVLPDGVHALHDAPVRATFSNVAPDQTVTLVVPVGVETAEPRTITANATLDDAVGLRASRAFVLTLNPAPPPADTGRPGRNRAGEPLIIYPSGQP